MKKGKKIGIGLLCLVLAGGILTAALNLYVVQKGKQRILSSEEAAELNADCILVLGCGLRADGSPSRMLQDRLDRGIELYQNAAAPKLLMSGDHGRAGYDEVNAMGRSNMMRSMP